MFDNKLSIQTSAYYYVTVYKQGYRSIFIDLGILKSLNDFLIEIYDFFCEKIRC